MEKIIFLLTFVFEITWTFFSLGTGFSLGTHIAKPFRMTISNALPVQFWDEAEETFNEKQVCGIDQICWCMPWHCAEPLPFQLTDTEQIDYILRITNSQGVETDIPFEYEATELLTDINTWDQFGFETAWSDVGTDHPTVSVASGAQSNRLRGYPLLGLVPSGETVLISFKFTVTDDAMSVVFRFRNSGSNITPLPASIPVGVGVTEDSFEYTGDADWDDMTIEVINASGSTGNLYIDYIIGYRDSESANIVYSLSVIPQDIGICDDQVSFQIIDPSTSPETVIKKSDCLQIKESIDCTLAIDYSNNKNFNGLIFEDVSPSTTFRIRIPARFFSEDNPSEQEDTELSNGEFVRLYNKLEERRQLEVGFVPQYMHRKIQLALMCDNVTIDEKQWIRKETYEKVEGRKTYPLKRANVWLHDKDFIKENQL